MIRGRAAVLPLVAALAPLALFVFGSPVGAAVAAEGSTAPRPGRVILLVEDRVSFEELLAVPQFHQLAAAGGAALMTTHPGEGNPENSRYLTLGAGAVTPGGGTTNLLAHALETAGLDICLASPSPQPLVQPGPAVLLAGGVSAHACVPRPAAGAFHGGGPWPPEGTVAIFADAETLRIDTGGVRGEPGQEELLRRRALQDEGTFLEMFRSDQRVRTLVLVVTPSPSSEMDASGDEVTPLLMAVASPGRPILSQGSRKALRSDTTRQTGLVSNVDVAPTILDFFGLPVPAEMDGSPIRFTDDPAPFALHRRHLEQRRIRVPLQLGEVSSVAAGAIVAFAGLVVLGRRGRVSARLAAVLRWLALTGTAILLPLLAGGLLPRFTYALAVPFVVAGAVGLALLARAARWRGSLGPLVFVGAAGLAFLVVDAAFFGGRAFRIPLLGGTMFDGVRFYGLPNSFIALLLFSALFVAIRLPPFGSTMLLVGAGLFAGFPRLGANVGASITLFTAAGLWWALRTRPRFRIREAAFVAGTVALGLAAVLLANRWFPGTPTHVTRFVEGSGSRLGSAFDDVRNRLSVGWDQLNDVPVAWLPLLGLPLVFVLVGRRSGPIAEGLLAVDEHFREALMVLCATGVVAYFVNDTGVAAAAPVFLPAMAGMVYAAFRPPNTVAGPGTRPPARAAVTP